MERGKGRSKIKRAMTRERHVNKQNNERSELHELKEWLEVARIEATQDWGERHQDRGGYGVNKRREQAVQ